VAGLCLRRRVGACDGHVVVAIRRDLDIIGAADGEAAITALVVPDRCLVIDISALDYIDRGSLDAAAAGLHGRGARYGVRPLAVSTARSGWAAPSRTGTW
jgi:hypothetical protein